MRTRLPYLLTIALACRDAGPAPKPPATPPSAEFILAAGDSAYWVTSGAGGVHVRGVPLELAQLGNRFYEVYVVDDDHSYQGADLVGQSVYRRDLQSGDSIRIFTDSIVPALARSYARNHPDDRPLGPDDDGDDNPELRATATLEFAGTHGPFVSYSLHTDVEHAEDSFWHTSRHGVLDLRTGRAARLTDIAGSDAQDVERRRDEELRAVIDSVRARASQLLPHFHFDATSFTITTVKGAPAIAWAIPTIGSGEMDQTLPLPPVSFSRPEWWTQIADGLPEPSPDGLEDAWHHGQLTVLARYDSAGDARLLLRDKSAHEFDIGPVSAPANRIYWLDLASFDMASRHALSRAFEEAATYGTDVHVASRKAVATRTHLHQVTYSP